VRPSWDFLPVDDWNEALGGDRNLNCGFCRRGDQPGGPCARPSSSLSLSVNRGGCERVALLAGRGARGRPSNSAGGVSPIEINGRAISRCLSKSPCTSVAQPRTTPQGASRWYRVRATEAWARDEVRAAYRRSARHPRRWACRIHRPDSSHPCFARRPVAVGAARGHVQRPHVALIQRDGNVLAMRDARRGCEGY